MATPTESAPASSAATFLFADIAGFTALTEAHGDEQAATLAADFSDAVKAELPACDGAHIKSIGDALMLRIPDPVELVAAVRIAQATEAQLAIAPVCHMAVDPERAAGRLMYDGTAYFFCTLECAGEFARGPERFTQRG